MKTFTDRLLFWLLLPCFVALWLVCLAFEQSQPTDNDE
jgi:hypothetical protein